jgi:hypothetical protein
MHELGAGWLRDVRDADHRADYMKGGWGCQLGAGDAEKPYARSSPSVWSIPGTVVHFRYSLLK